MGRARARVHCENGPTGWLQRERCLPRGSSCHDPGSQTPESLDKLREIPGAVQESARGADHWPAESTDMKEEEEDEGGRSTSEHSGCVEGCVDGGWPSALSPSDPA